MAHTGAQLSGSGAQLSGSGAQLSGSGAQLSAISAYLHTSYLGAQLSASRTVPYQVPQFLPILRGVRPSLCKKKEKIYCAKTVGDTSEFHDARIC